MDVEDFWLLENRSGEGGGRSFFKQCVQERLALFWFIGAGDVELWLD